MVDPRSERPSRRRFAGRARPTLVLGGLAAAASMTLGGCESAPEFQDAQFTTVAECTKAGFPDSVCQAGFDAALANHQGSAPRFANLKACEQEWGADHCIGYTGANAVANNAGGSSVGNVFVPMLAGFVVSQALQRRYYEDGYVGYYGGYGGGYGRPIYRSRTGGTVTVDRSGGRAIATPVNVNTTTVARSGFGGMGMSRGSGGGGFRFGG
ncbi:MAG TPA: DUF1190 domain-containing protein [Novosphingobium sp.]